MAIVKPETKIARELAPLVQALVDACAAVDAAIARVAMGENPPIHRLTVGEMAALGGSLDYERERLNGIIRVLEAVGSGEVLALPQRDTTPRDC